MFGSLQTYLNAIQRTWQAQDGTLVATFLSLRDKHALNPNLHVENAENMVDRILNPPIDEVALEHIKVLHYLSRSRKLPSVLGEYFD